MHTLLTMIVRTILLGVAASACVHAATVEERLAKQRELDNLATESKIAEARARLANTAPTKPANGMPERGQSLSMPLPPAANMITDMIAMPQPQAPSRDDFTLLGVFGIGDALDAEIRYRDMVFTVPVGAEIADGWKVSKLGPRFADLRREVAPSEQASARRAKKGHSFKSPSAPVEQSLRIYITSTGVKDVSTAARPVVSGASSLPPLPPVNPPASPPVAGAAAPAFATGALLPQGIRTN